MTNRIPTPPDARTVIVGVDTHTHVHVAVAIDSWGIRLRDHAFVVDSGGYQALITWAETHGRIDAFGIEGTGSYGAGLARAVRRAGHRVVEVNRGDRRTRRAAGKSDTLDAEVAARSVLAGQSTAIPKTADGAVEMMRQLKITRDTAVKARTTAMNTLKQIVVHAPPALREALHDLEAAQDTLDSDDVSLYHSFGTVEACLLGVDDAGLRMRRNSQRLTEQAFGRRGIAQAREHEVDRGAGGIDGSEEVAPTALDTNVGLIDTPGLIGWLEMTA